MNIIPYDVIPLIYLHLDIDTLQNACYLNKNLKNQCNSKTFWIKYFKYNNLNIYFNYTNYNMNDWVDSYKQTRGIYDMVLLTINYLKKKADINKTSRITFYNISVSILPFDIISQIPTINDTGIRIFFWDNETTIDIMLFKDGNSIMFEITEKQALDIMTAIYYHYPDKWLIF